MVAGTGLEPVNKGYEPFEFPVTLSGDITLVFPSSQQLSSSCSFSRSHSKDGSVIILAAGLPPTDDSTPSLLLSVGCRTCVFSNLENLECVVRHQKYPKCVQFVRRQPRFQRNGNNPKLSPSARSRRQDSTTTDY